MITLYSHKFAPNGWKVAIVLESLGIKYETKFLDFATGEHKSPEHTRHNPNGRIPTIIDHDNGDFVLWESNTIIRYLVERYDTNHKIHFAVGTKESYVIDQWMNFQNSGLGSALAGIAHFSLYHETKLPTAINHYQKETIRTISVLDEVLKGKEYLVGDKFTIADICFIMGDELGLNLLLKGTPSEEEARKYTNFIKWHERVLAYPAVKKTLEERAQGLAAN